MKPSRRSQPYRRGSQRTLGATLEAMTRGRTAQGHNPQDVKRAMQKKPKRAKNGSLRAQLNHRLKYRK
jgi:hypothetical protein